MSTFICKMCGANLQVNGNSNIVKCEYCDAMQTVSVSTNEEINKLFESANRYIIKYEFDKAIMTYEHILELSDHNSEAYWGICLSDYGVEYVVDPKTQKRVPTCHRTKSKSLLNDENYLFALKYATDEALKHYKSQAEYIDKIQKNILSVSSKEEPYDIFICYKETDENGNRTVDSVIAQDIYQVLTEKGYRTFFSRITLEDKLGISYEPYIYSALNSAKVMLVVGTKIEYYNSVWVKNEWSRFLSLRGNTQDKILIPCYRDMSPYDLPNEFSALQAQDVSKVGYIQDLVRGISKIIPLKNDNNLHEEILDFAAQNNKDSVSAKRPIEKVFSIGSLFSFIVIALIYCFYFNNNKVPELKSDILKGKDIGEAFKILFMTFESLGIVSGFIGLFIGISHGLKNKKIMTVGVIVQFFITAVTIIISIIIDVPDSVLDYIFTIFLLVLITVVWNLISIVTYGIGKLVSKLF